MDGVAGGGMEGWEDGGMAEEVGRRARLPSERTIGLTAGGWEEEEEEEEDEEEEDEDEEESAGFKERQQRSAPEQRLGVCVCVCVCVCMCVYVCVCHRARTVILWRVFAAENFAAAQAEKYLSNHQASEGSVSDQPSHDGNNFI